MIEIRNSSLVEGLVVPGSVWQARRPKMGSQVVIFTGPLIEYLVLCQRLSWAGVEDGHVIAETV